MVTERGVAVGPEHAVGGGAARVHHPLRDALVVEVGDLLPEVEVLQQRRPPRPGLQRMVGVRQPHALRRGQELTRLTPRITRRGPATIDRPPGRALYFRRNLILLTFWGHQ